MNTVEHPDATPVAAQTAAPAAERRRAAEFVSSVLRNDSAVAAVLAALAGVIALWPFFSGRLLLIYTDIGSDTYNSFWPRLTLISDYLCAEGVPRWSWSVGLGHNVFPGWLNDPFNIAFAIFPRGAVPVLLPYVLLAKVVLTAPLFSSYLRIIGVGRHGALLGALSIALSAHMIGRGSWYPTASTQLVVAAFVLLALELALRRGRWFLLAFALATVVTTNPFNFYWYGLASTVYVVLWCIAHEQARRDQLVLSRRFAMAFAAAVGCAAFLILPFVHQVAQTPRVGAGEASTFSRLLTTAPWSLASTLEYLGLARVFSNEILGNGLGFRGFASYFDSPVLYAGILPVVLVPLVFMGVPRRQQFVAGLVVVGTAIYATFPFARYAANAFSGESFRHSDLFITIGIAIAGAKGLDQLMRLAPRRRTQLLLIAVTVCLVGILWGLSHRPETELTVVRAAIAFSILYGLILVFTSHSRMLASVAVAVLLIELTWFSHRTLTERAALPASYLSSGVGYFDETAEAVSFIRSIDSDFYRVHKDYSSVFFSDALIQGYRGEPVYDSFNSHFYVDLMHALDEPLYYPYPNTVSYIPGFGSRLAAHTLVGVRYVLARSPPPWPGLGPIHTVGRVTVYRNRNALPLGFTYDTAISRSALLSYPPFEREHVMLAAAVVDEPVRLPAQLPIRSEAPLELGPSLAVRDPVPANALFQPAAGLEEFAYTPVAGDPQLLVSVEAPNAQHLVLEMDVEASTGAPGQVFWDSRGANLSEAASTRFRMNAGRHHYTIDLGRIAPQHLRLDLGDGPGPRFVVTSLSLRPVLSGKINARDDEAVAHLLAGPLLRIEDFGENWVHGKIELRDPRLLFLSIPFDDGWRLEVDGELTPLRVVNIAFMGAMLGPGLHDIRLSYSPPMLRLGLVISAATLLALLAVRLRHWRPSRPWGKTPVASPL